MIDLAEDIIRHLTVHVDAIEEGPSPMMQKGGRDDDGEPGESPTVFEGAA